MPTAHVGGDGRHIDRKIREAAAVERVVGGECDDFAGRPINPHPRADLEGVALDPGLKLLVAVIREPDWTIREEHRRQCDVKWERRVVASAESAAAIGELVLMCAGLTAASALPSRYATAVATS